MPVVVTLTTAGPTFSISTVKSGGTTADELATVAVAEAGGEAAGGEADGAGADACGAAATGAPSPAVGVGGDFGERGSQATMAVAANITAINVGSVRLM